jgi:hypothetical protein
MTPTSNIPQRITILSVLSAEVPQYVSTKVVMAPAVTAIHITGAQW